MDFITKPTHPGTQRVLDDLERVVSGVTGRSKGINGSEQDLLISYPTPELLWTVLTGRRVDVSFLLLVVGWLNHDGSCKGEVCILGENIYEPYIIERNPYGLPDQGTEKRIRMVTGRRGVPENSLRWSSVTVVGPSAQGSSAMFETLESACTATRGFQFRSHW